MPNTQPYREGLVYWGEGRQIIEYGPNYRVDFFEKINQDSNYLAVSIYIKKEVIEKYRKRKMFREEMKDLVVSTKNRKCFFVGTYPQLT